MTKVMATILFVLSISRVLATEAQVPGLEVVHIFDNGPGPTQLVLAVPHDTGVEPLERIDICSFDDGDFAILNGNSQSMKFFDQNFVFLAEVGNLGPYLEYVYDSGERLVALGGIPGQLDLVVIDPSLGFKKILEIQGHRVTLKSIKFLVADGDTYFFRGSDSAENFKYLAIKSGKDSKNYSVLSDSETQVYLKSIKRTKQALLVDGLLSFRLLRAGNSEKARDGSVWADLAQSDNTLSSSRGFLTLSGNQDQVLRRFSLVEFRNRLMSSPHSWDRNGYVYTLVRSETSMQMLAYKIGPFPELLLDYNDQGGIINDNNVNLREEPNTKSASLSKLSNGTLVRVLAQTDKPETIAGQKGIWYQVRLWNRTEGWVFGAFLDVKKSE